MPDPAPVPVVLLGHWGDGRAAYCTDEGAAACAREFVVDGVAWELDDWRDPVAYAESPTLGEPPSRPSAEAAAARARSLSEGGLVASIARSDAADWLTMDPRIAGLGELRLAGSGWFVRLVGPGPGDGSRTVILVDGDAGMRELPAWPTRVPAADRVAASTIRDGAGRPLRCDGVTVDACRAAAAAVRAADPSAFAGDAVVGVVPAAPAWTSWPPGDGIVLVGTWRTGSDGSIESRSYRVRLATWTEDGVEPLASEGDRVPHLEAAWLALQGD